jgi:uncharacterized protein (DUF433 family)/predicted RNase H-like HicB family nuclease
MKREYTVVYQPIEDGWIMATVPELPGAVTQGRTMKEAREMMKEAVALLLESYRKNAAKEAPRNAVWETLSVELPALWSGGTLFVTWSSTAVISTERADAIQSIAIRRMVGPSPCLGIGRSRKPRRYVSSSHGTNTRSRRKGSDMNDRIVIDPAIQHGKPVIRGTRVPIVRIIGGLAGGMSTKEISHEYGVTEADVRAALTYASEVIDQDEHHPLPAA